MSYLFNNEVSFSGPLTDSFGRLRVSTPHVLFDSQLQNDKAPHLWSESITGSGSSSTHLPEEAAVRLRVGITTGETVIRQSRIYTRCQPGMSHLVMLTGILGEAKTNVVQRIGYFDNSDGIFIELYSGTLRVVRRSSASGSVVDTAIPQTSWSLDPLDGTGPSGITLDPSKTNIFIFDFQWLAVGRVRAGVVIGGDTIYYHEFVNANELTQVYVTSANLPPRYEIQNIGTTSSSTDLKQICASVISEGNFNPRGYLRHHGLTAPKGVSSTLVPVLSIRPNSLYKATWFEPINYQLVNTGNSYVYYKIILNPILTGASWQNTPASDYTQYDTSATALSGGTVLCGGYIYSNDQAESRSENNIPDIGTNIDGSRDHITIAMQTISGSTNVLAAINWKEVR